MCTQRAPRAHGERKKTVLIVTLLRLMLCWNYNMGGSSHTKTVFIHAWPRPHHVLISLTLIPTVERSFPTLTPPSWTQINTEPDICSMHCSSFNFILLLIFKPQYSGKQHPRAVCIAEKHWKLNTEIWYWQLAHDKTGRRIIYIQDFESWNRRCIVAACWRCQAVVTQISKLIHVHTTHVSVSSDV